MIYNVVWSSIVDGSTDENEKPILCSKMVSFVIYFTDAESLFDRLPICNISRKRSTLRARGRLSLQ